MSVESLSLHLVVVGKIIIDEYGKTSPGIVSIGGGGPQAAFGAAAALAAVSEWNIKQSHGESNSNPLPPKQPITFVGPVGKDWTNDDTEALNSMLGSAMDLKLVSSKEHITPRIQLWHDDKQCIQWRALHGSFGPKGADGLWANRPGAQDILSILTQLNQDDYQKDHDNDKNASFGCHVIVEGSHQGPAKGLDVAFLHDSKLRSGFAFVGAEPVAFCDPDTGRLVLEDAQAICDRLETIRPDFVCPDDEMYQSIPSEFWHNLNVAVRKGPRGSVVLPQHTEQPLVIPAATLATPDHKPVNPTGAGNSYSGALSALRHRGLAWLDAACIASAVGAVVCEYPHIPPWNANVITRIREGAKEIKGKVTEQMT
jgi:hypothetical protein